MWKVSWSNIQVYLNLTCSTVALRNSVRRAVEFQIHSCKNYNYCAQKVARSYGLINFIKECLLHLLYSPYFLLDYQAVLPTIGKPILITPWAFQTCRFFFMSWAHVYYINVNVRAWFPFRDPFKLKAEYRVIMLVIIQNLYKWYIRY